MWFNGKKPPQAVGKKSSSSKTCSAQPMRGFARYSLNSEFYIDLDDPDTRNALRKQLRKFTTVKK